MAEYTGPTDQNTQITLPSALEQVQWTQSMAAPGATVGLEVFTIYVGHNAEMEIELSDERGEQYGTFNDKIYGNGFRAGIVVPSEAREALYATVKLPAHGLEMTSGPLTIIPLVRITNAQWSQSEARRGDVLTLTADVAGAPDGTTAEITIFEHDADGAHDLITRFDVFVEGNRVETEWEYEYYEDTDDIPTEEETEQGYRWPEYFFRVNVLGVTAETDLLRFKDWIEVVYQDDNGEPMAEMEYVLYLADGSERNGALDAEGRAREEDVPPGPFRVFFPSLAEE